VENAGGEGGRQSGDREQDHQYERSAFHGAEIYPAYWLDEPPC
jgi:hypothetical protein